MEQLGSRPPEELGRLLAGSITCAVFILVFIIVYFVVARRGSQVKTGTDFGVRGGITSQRPRSSGFPTTPPPAPVRDYAVKEPSAVDIGARLAGTGREAWLQEAPPVKGPSPPGQEVLRVVRDPATGETWIKVAGVRHRSLNDIRDRAVGERVLAAISYVLRFSNGRVATDRGVEVLALPACDSVKIPAAFGALSEAYEPGEILRLISDSDRNDFCVQVIDRCYRRLVDVSDQATGQRILEGITRLLQFSNGMLATNDGVGVVPVPSLSADAMTPLPAPSGPAAPSPEPQPSVGPLPASVSEQERFLRQLMGSAPAMPEEPIKPPSLISSLRGTWKKPSSAPSSSLDLVTEINRIFQSKLGVSPLAKTDAQVEASPDGGVRIRVGTVYYDTPDDVPDARLREILKLSIAEWEQS